MRNILFFLLLVISSNAFSANWTKVVSNARADLFIDKDSVNFVNEQFYYWNMMNMKRDYISSENVNILSAKNYEVIDCKSSTTQLLKSILYSQKDGQGKVMKTFSFKEDINKMRTIPLGTTVEEVRNFICGIDDRQ